MARCAEVGGFCRFDRFCRTGGASNVWPAPSAKVVPNPGGEALTEMPDRDSDLSDQSRSLQRLMAAGVLGKSDSGDAQNGSHCSPLIQGQDFFVA
jgi:hypothetical protein